MGAATIDGRVQRGARNRQAIVDALVELYRAGELQPTAQQIAARAGVAPRSVYHHFADLETLAAEVAARQIRDHRHLVDLPPPTGELTARIAEVVGRRAELFEAVSPVRRAAMLQVHRSPTIRRHLDGVATRLRAQLSAAFAAELVARPEALDALDLLTSWEAWERLRTQQQLTTDQARAVLATTIRAVLTEGPER